MKYVKTRARDVWHIDFDDEAVIGELALFTKLKTGCNIRENNYFEDVVEEIQDRKPNELSEWVYLQSLDIKRLTALNLRRKLYAVEQEVEPLLSKAKCLQKEIEKLEGRK